MTGITGFSQAPLPGRFTNDPRYLPRYSVHKGRPYFCWQETNHRAYSSGFWGAIAECGSYIVCSTTADTYYTIVDATSTHGLMSAIITPEGSGAGEFATARVTVDGVEHLITVASTHYTEARGCLGGWIDSQYYMGFTGGVDEGNMHYDSPNANENLYLRAPFINGCDSGYAYTTAGRYQGIDPLVVEFKTSLKVEVKNSGTISTSDYSDYAGVIWQPFET
jgi:hypothetical protein